MDKAITTVFMIIVSIVISVMVFNTVYPAAVRGSDSLVSMRTRMDERMKTQIAMVHATGELDSSGNWQDTNGDGRFNVFIWVKNIGSLRIAAVTDVDVFFGPEGNFMRIPYKDDAGGSYPYWDWQVENDTHWNPTATARIIIYYSTPLARGSYFVKIVTPSGPADDSFFSL